MSAASSSEKRDENAIEIPHLYTGQLLARHVSRFTVDEPPACAWCGEAFVEGDEYMLDTYQQEGMSDTVLHINSRPLKFSKTKILMVHAGKICIANTCAKAVRNCTEKVSIVQRNGREIGDQDSSQLVYECFRWSVQWIAWHHRFLIGPDDHVAITLATRRPPLIGALCKSFSLVLLKSGPSWRDILVPLHLVEFTLFEGLFTRVYEYDLEYAGKYQPVMQLSSALDKAQINTQTEGVNAAIYAHMIIASSFGSSRSNDQHIKLLVKIRPSQVHVEQLLKLYKATGVTWSVLFEDLLKANNATVDWDENSEDVRKSLDDLYQSFEQFESQLHGAILAAGFNSDYNLRRMAICNLNIAQSKSKQIEIALNSNCYIPTTKAARAYYIFREVKHESEQPLFCYEGVLGGALPIVVASAQQLNEETKDACLKPVELPELRVLVPHLKQGEPLRVVKRD